MIGTFFVSLLVSAGGCESYSLDEKSWIRSLPPEKVKGGDVREPRLVFDGHWVKALPTWFHDEVLVACSEDTLRLVGLNCSVDLKKEFGGEYWATPYALSIYGSATVPDYAGPNSEGYGDGRAMSFAELVHDGRRFELQLKGAGRTAFARRGDGRAVLRSSVREFLASEAMAGLRVPTTRVANLFVSEKACVVSRPWYLPNVSSTYKHGGDVMREERCAYSTRIAPSFVRVAHFELHAITRNRIDQLKQLARYAFEVRDDWIQEEEWLGSFVRQAAVRQARLVAEWTRVGYVQSNFNSDNCLVSGLTVDFGPFGFLERYRPDWVMWVGGGQHYSFLNQQEAARRNFEMFRKSVRLACDTTACKRQVDDVEFVDDRYRVFANKLGFPHVSERSSRIADHLFQHLMIQYHVDYTILFYQLTLIAESSRDQATDSYLMNMLEPAFYDDEGDAPPDFVKAADWMWWLREWLFPSFENEEDDVPDSALMRQSNAKYIPREWMLAEAYTAAEKGDFSIVHRLHRLFLAPYDDHPDLHDAYFRRAPVETRAQGGVGFMS